LAVHAATVWHGPGVQSPALLQHAADPAAATKPHWPLVHAGTSHSLAPAGQGLHDAPQLLTLALLLQMPPQSWKPALQLYWQAPPVPQLVAALACGAQQLPPGTPAQNIAPSGQPQLPSLQVAPAVAPQSLLVQHWVPVTQRVGPAAQ
jgi:hypothetical protein